MTTPTELPTPNATSMVGGMSASTATGRLAFLPLVIALVLIALVGCSSTDRGPDTVELSVPRPEAVWAVLGEERLGGAGAVKEIADRYLERYFEMFPSRATASGYPGLDGALEDLSAERLSDWFKFAQTILDSIAEGTASDCADGADALKCASARVDGDLLRREIELHLLDWQEGAEAQTNPALWSQIAGSSTVYLLVRHDRPLPERLSFVRDRLQQVPALLQQAQAELVLGDPARRTVLQCQMAAGQSRSLAGFYRDRLLVAAGIDVAIDSDALGALADELRTAGQAAADALESYAKFVTGLEASSTGSSVLGPEVYERRFALYTGLKASSSEVLASAEAALEQQLDEADRWAQKLWDELFDGDPPAERADRVRALFLKLGDDRAQSIEEFVADYRALVDQAEAFVKQNDVVSTVDPLTLVTDRSPSFFSGAAVGGVYSAGPYTPGADTLLFLPTPPESFDEEQTSRFFRDFNHYFNVMITPHELMPGHYLQLKWAALHPSKVRAMFGDAVTIEGWGTFAERLMLDLGWGDDLAYAAHLKKRLENTARAIVDIRVHTLGMDQDEVERFVIEDALQEEQFARNMRRRTLTTSPQLVTYYVGNREIERVFARYLESKGVETASALPPGGVREFTDGVMAMGPVPLSAWSEFSELMALAQ